MKNPKIKGLNKLNIQVLLTFMESKLKDSRYIKTIEIGGNECDMSWIEDDMDISGDDMIHELFELYGEEDDGEYNLKIGNNIFTTWKENENYLDEYRCKLQK